MKASRQISATWLGFFILLWILAHPAPAFDRFTDVLRGEEPLNDVRTTTAALKKFDTPQTFVAPKSLKDWEKRKAELRQRILVSAGLWPMPEKTDLHPEIFERKEHERYTVEKVLLETYPGFFLTGNLYRPKAAGAGKKYPAILSPHGHWDKGRFEDSA